MGNKSKSPPKTRVSRKVAIAVEKMVDHALTRPEAAKLAGLTDHALYCALRKPHVQAYRHERMEVLRSSEASRTIKRVADLADTSKSDAVKLDANVWLAGIDGIAPVTKGEVHHTHSGIVPGLTVVFGGWKPHTIEGKPVDVAEAAHIQRIGVPAPHPEAVANGFALPHRVPHPSEESA